MQQNQSRIKKILDSEKEFLAYPGMMGVKGGHGE
jgi:hypothetical protein